MTREEARDQIVIFMNDEHEVINDRDREALDMAIKALEQEPKIVKMRDATLKERKSIDKYIQSISTAGVDFWDLEPCEDCVSRQAVLDALDKRFDSVPMEQTTEILLLRKDLRELPSVTPTRKKGKWTSVTEDTPPKGTICLWCNKQRSVFASEITYRTERNSYVGKHGYFSNGLENYGNIVAWMPLPEPYKAEMESEE